MRLVKNNKVANTVDPEVLFFCVYKYGLYCKSYNCTSLFFWLAKLQKHQSMWHCIIGFWTKKKWSDQEDDLELFFEKKVRKKIIFNLNFLIAIYTYQSMNFTYRIKVVLQKGKEEHIIYWHILMVCLFHL